LPALDQDGLGAAEDSTGVTGLDSVVGTGAMVSDGELDDELHAPTNIAVATINMARTALMTGFSSCLGVRPTLGRWWFDERFRKRGERCRTL
jgi:hypothetical protein